MVIDALEGGKMEWAPPSHAGHGEGGAHRVRGAERRMKQRLNALPRRASSRPDHNVSPADGSTVPEIYGASADEP
jgi:hypothetical protein